MSLIPAADLRGTPGCRNELLAPWADECRGWDACPGPLGRAGGTAGPLGRSFGVEAWPLPFPRPHQRPSVASGMNVRRSGYGRSFPPARVGRLTPAVRDTGSHVDVARVLNSSRKVRNLSRWV